MQRSALDPALDATVAACRELIAARFPDTADRGAADRLPDGGTGVGAVSDGRRVEQPHRPPLHGATGPVPGGMIDPVRIRQATANDAPRIAEVHVRSWQGGYLGQLPEAFLAALDPGQRAERWHAILTNPAGPTERTLVAEEPGHEESGEVQGFVSIGPSRDPGTPRSVGEVWSLYVTPAAWGAGVGRRLMSAALEALRAGGWTSATLWVLATNARAIGFYEVTGWVADGAAKEIELAGGTCTELRYGRTL